MFESQRQHPAAAVAKALDIIKGNFITIVFIIFLGGGGDRADFTLYWILGTIICLLIWGVISWYRFTFRISDGELQIEQGVVVHKKLYLTADRIQVIDISAGIVQRLFGLVAVEVKTAGSTSKDAKISAISREKAEELKTLLRKKSSEDVEEYIPDEKKLVYSLDSHDLLIAATTSGRLGVALSIVGAVFSQVDQLFTEQQIFNFVEANIPHSTSVSIIIFSVIGIFLISWVLSFITTIIQYYDFSVEVKEDELLITRGLFEKTQLTIPFNRIQAVQIKEELLRQPFGYASLVIESAGYGETQGNSTTLFPLIGKEKIYHFINEVIPEYSTELTPGKSRLSRRALRRYLLRMVWFSLIFIAIAWSSIPYGVYSWFILIPALLLGYWQYYDAGVNSDGNTLILSSRLVSKTTAIVKKYRMQSVEIKQNPFQTRLNLSNFTVSVASGNQGRSFTVRELGQQQAYRHLEWISNGKKGLSNHP
ncbi:MAG TPA: PH domain-containing protein [Balneolaceae bacterium]